MNWIQQRWANRSIYRYHFLQSTYITALWTWFLTFWGKAAEPFLCVSVLYNGAKLMPGVSTAPEVDTVMFIGQMLALDIGGLSLSRIAQQLERDGEKKQASFLKSVSFFLIGIMIANVVLATVQHIFPDIDRTIITGIESSLLILRSIMAVIYGYIIYNLHPGSKQETSVVKSSEVKSQFDEVVNTLATLEKKLTDQEEESQRTREELTKKLTDQTVNTHRVVKAELTEMLTDQAVNIQGNVRDELTSLLNRQIAHVNTQVAKALHDHGESIGTQVTLAMGEHTASLAASLSQQLNEHLVMLTARMVEELTPRRDVNKSVNSTDELTPESVNTRRENHSRVNTTDELNVNSVNTTGGKKRLVEECLVNNPMLNNADILRLLKEQGIDVTAAYVSQIRNGKRA
jgi:hypothetical protein